MSIRTQQRNRWFRWVLRGALALLGVAVVTPIAGLAWLQLGMSDVARGRLLSRALNHFLPGSFSVDEFAWHWSQDIELRGVVIDAPTDRDVGRARYITAHAYPLALLERRLIFDDIQVHDPVVRITDPGDGGDVTIARAFDRGGPPGAEETVGDANKKGWRIELRGVAVQNATLTVQTPGVRVASRKLDITAADFWLQGQELGLTIDLDSEAELHSAPLDLAFKVLHVETRNATYRFAHDNKRVATDAVSIVTAGLRLNAKGELLATDTTVKKFKTTGSARIDTRSALLRKQLPRRLSKDLRGLVKTTFTFAGSSKYQRFEIDANSDSLAWRHITIPFVKLGAEYDGETLLVNKLLAGVDTSQVSAEGKLVMRPNAATLIGTHDITLVTHNLGVRQLFGPLVEQPGLLPRWVSLNVRSQGKGLWPMSSSVELDATAQGVPASWMPGLADPLYVHGELRTSPTAIDVVRVQFGTHDDQNAFGAHVPIKDFGIMTVFRSLHRVSTLPSTVTARAAALSR